MSTTWDSELADFLRDLSLVQRELLDLLAEKRRALAAADRQAMQALHDRERGLGDRLQACHDRRANLLALARAEGLDASCLRDVAATLPPSARAGLARQFRESTSRCRLLQHESLTNWLIAQRGVLHLAQMLEILATGGRPRPTYQKGELAHEGGRLVDRAA